MPGGLPPLDFLMLTALVLVIVNGGRRGFLKEVTMLVGVAAGTALAGQFGPSLAKLIWREDTRAQNTLMGYLGVLVIVLLIVALAASMIRPVLRNPTLRGIDLSAGLALGAFEGVILLGVASSVAARFGMLSRDNSMVGPFMINTLAMIMPYVPGGLGPVEKLLTTGTGLPLI